MTEINGQLPLFDVPEEPMLAKVILVDFTGTSAPEVEIRADDGTLVERRRAVDADFPVCPACEVRVYPWQPTAWSGGHVYHEGCR